MPDVLDDETEIRKLDAEIVRLEQQQVTERAAADRLRDDVLSSGVDVTKLNVGDDAFVKVDEAYLVADTTQNEVDRLRSVREKLYGWAGRSRSGPGGAPSGGSDEPQRRRTLGQRVTESEIYQASKALAKNPKADFRMGSVEVMTREELINGLRYRAGLDLASGQALVTPEFQLIPPVELPVRQPRLISLIHAETTESDSVVWGQQTERVLAAAPTPSGVNAPQATMAFQRQTSNVERIPVLLTVPKEVLADEGRLQGILDVQLMRDTALEVEYQALKGDGTGSNFKGILETTGIGSIVQGGGSTDYVLDAVHQAITYVRLHLYEDPDAIGLHPTDLEFVMLQKDGFGRYIFDPAAEQSRIWGFQVASTPVFDEGTGLVGNFEMGSTIWVREDVVVTATDGYTDVVSGTNYFSAGLVAIMAQVRAAYAVQRPFAYCEVTSLRQAAG